MNERIKELAEQAREYANSSQPYEKIKNKGWIDVYDEKFAELIVRECAETLINSQYAKTFNDYYDGFNEALEYGASEIKQHFGVE